MKFFALTIPALSFLVFVGGALASLMNSINSAFGASTEPAATAVPEVALAILAIGAIVWLRQAATTPALPERGWRR